MCLELAETIEEVRVKVICEGKYQLVEYIYSFDGESEICSGRRSLYGKIEPTAKYALESGFGKIRGSMESILEGLGKNKQVNFTDVAVICSTRHKFPESKTELKLILRRSRFSSK